MLISFFPQYWLQPAVPEKKADALQERQWQDGTLATAGGAPAPALLMGISEQLGEARG